jgi:hypothetical protein
MHPHPTDTVAPLLFFFSVLSPLLFSPPAAATALFAMLIYVIFLIFFFEGSSPFHLIHFVLELMLLFCLLSNNYT